MPEISYIVFNIGTGINEGIRERINDSASGCISHYKAYGSFHFLPLIHGSLSHYKLKISWREHMLSPKRQVLRPPDLQLRRCDCLRKHFDDLVVDVNVLGITKCV